MFVFFVGGKNVVICGTLAFFCDFASRRTMCLAEGKIRFTVIAVKRRAICSWL